MKTNVNFFTFKCCLTLYTLLPLLYIGKNQRKLRMSEKMKNVSLIIFELLTGMDSPLPTIIILSLTNF